jgi:hypothetical protein
MVSPEVCDAQLQANSRTRAAITATLCLPRWQSVRFEAKFFKKNYVNSSLKCEKKKRPQAGAFCISRKGRVRGKF